MNFTETAVLQSVPAIPQLRPLGREEEKEEKKRGAVPWLPQAGSSGLTLAKVASSKLGLLGLTAILSLSAVSIGRSLAVDREAFLEMKNNPKTIAFKAALLKNRYDYSGDTSRLPSDSRTNQNSVGMVRGLGKISDQASAEDFAAEEAARKAAEEEAAEEGAAGEGAAEEEQAPGFQDVLKRRFGDLSKPSGFSSTLAGGAGLSAGVGRAFDAPRFKTEADKLRAMMASVKTGRLSRGRLARVGRSRHSRALGQLERAAEFSRLSRSGSAESRSSLAGAPFDHNPGGGSSISGFGMSENGGATDAPGSPNPSDVKGEGKGEGEDGEQEGKPCGGGTNLQGALCVPNQRGESKDPADTLMLVTQILTMAATVLLGILFALQKFEFLAPLQALIAPLRVAIGVIGAVIFLLSVALMAMGRPIFGGINAVIGGLIVVFMFPGVPAFLGIGLPAIEAFAGLGGLLGAAGGIGNMFSEKK